MPRVREHGGTAWNERATIVVAGCTGVEWWNGEMNTVLLISYHTTGLRIVYTMSVFLILK